MVPRFALFFLSILAAVQASAATPSTSYMLVFKRQLLPQEMTEIQSLSSVERFEKLSPYKSEYFKRVYLLQMKRSDRDLQKIKRNPLLKTIEADQPVDFFSVTDATQRRSTPATDDPFVNQQWGLVNTGQTVQYNIDDVRSEQWVGTPGMDIGAKELLTDIESQMKRETVVAIIDSGLDIDHPDIKNNIFRNLAECDEGQIPGGAKDDKDNNGYTGDCMGWNFATLDPGMRNRPLDDVGHGTHIAGIIAAEKNNGIGVSGISNKIKIMPLKVLISEAAEQKLVEENNENTEKKNISITSRIVQAVLYATMMKVDVINLSLGWPDRADSEIMRQAFQAALDQNITFVAAAGNNDNALQIFPCAYKDVICVGAIDNRGKYALFSNFGGHVDILAPGNKILSLAPTMSKKQVFPVTGYAFSSGTSQAAPYVAGAIAVLKGKFPQIRRDEIAARLFAGARFKPDDPIKTSIAGLVNLTATLTATPRPMVRPEFKDLNRTTFSMKNPTISLSIPVKNYWGDAKSISVKVESLSSNYKLLSGASIELGDLKTGELKPVPLKAQILSLSADSEFAFALSLYANGDLIGRYKHAIVVSRSMRDDDSFLVHKILNTPDKNIHELSTVYTQGQNSVWANYAISEINDQRAQIQIYSREGSSYKKTATLTVPHADTVFLLTRADLNYDGRLDYLVISRYKKAHEEKSKTEIYFQYSFFKDNGDPLFGQLAHFRLDFKAEFINLKNFLSFSQNFSELRFVRINTPYGPFAMPLFSEYGSIPAADFNHSVFDFAPNSIIKRLYYFKPVFSGDQQILSVRVFNNNEFEKSLRKKNKLKTYENIDFLELLPQPEKQRRLGEASILISMGEGYVRRYLVLKINEKTLDERAIDSLEIGSPNEAFWGGELLSTIGGGRNIEKHGEDMIYGASYITFFSPRLATLSFLDLENYGIQTFKLSYSNHYDGLVKFMKGYQIDDTYYGVYFTQSHLLFHINGPAGSKILTRTVLRTTFLPGQQFEETIQPLIYNGAPAFYIYAGLVSSHYIYLLTMDRGELIESAELNVDIPPNCRSLDPVRDENGIFNYSILCKGSDGLEVRHLPLAKR